MSGKALYLEIMACRLQHRREKALLWLEEVNEWQEYTLKVERLAKIFVKGGIDEWDARHLATAQAAKCRWFLTTDLTVIKRARKLDVQLDVRVANPTEFILEDIQ